MCSSIFKKRVTGLGEGQRREGGRAAAPGPRAAAELALAVRRGGRPRGRVRPRGVAVRAVRRHLRHRGFRRPDPRNPIFFNGKDAWCF